MRIVREYGNKRKIAHHYCAEKDYTVKQVAEMLDITPKTVGEWARKYAWKQERQAREISVRSHEENRDQVLSGPATDRKRIRELIMEQEASPQPGRELIRELRKQISRIDDTVSKRSKVRITVQKDERVPLDIYLQVVDNIFDSLRLFGMELYTRTLDFQEQHIYQIFNNKQQMALTQDERQARERYLEKLKFVRNGSRVNPFESKEGQQAAIKRAQKNMEFMVERCLPYYATSKYTPLQNKLASRVARDPQCMELVRWEGGLAKSAWRSLIIPLWLWIRKESVYLIIVGNNQDKAEPLLADIQAEFEGDPQLIKGFEELEQNRSWEYVSFRTAGGRFTGKIISMGTSLRGLGTEALRPNLLMADDLEGEDTVKNSAWQDGVVQWIEADLIPTINGLVQRYPYPNNGSAPRTIQNRLEKRHPDWHVDIVRVYDKKAYTPV